MARECTESNRSCFRVKRHMTPPQSPYGLHWTPVDISGLHPKPVFGKDYLWYESRVRVRVRDLRLGLGFFLGLVRCLGKGFSGLGLGLWL
jgi:hypothetical protein